MRNVINYFYNLNILDIYNIDNKYYFNYKNNNYFFMEFDRPLEDAPSIYNITQELNQRKVLTNDIIINKDEQIITILDGKPYVLIRDNTKNKNININDILYIQNNTFNILKEKKLYRTDWIKMWESKIDFYEEQINNMSNKYNSLYKTIDFYIGMGENAISYLVNNKVINSNVCLSHKRINLKKGSFDFYNPINYILDSRVRDFAELTKYLFFHNQINFELFKTYLDYLNFTRDECILLIARLMFPTFYFDLYDYIINYNLDEKIIENVLINTDKYIEFIRNILIYLIYQKRMNIPYIEWIIKDTN